MNKTSAGKSNIFALYCVTLFTTFSTGQKKVGHISKYKAHILKFLRPIFFLFSKVGYKVLKHSAVTTCLNLSVFGNTFLRRKCMFADNGSVS